jgi:hypothetical protein
MLAIILTAPPQAWQVSMSMLNTRLSRCAQVIAARRSAGVGSSGIARCEALASPAPFSRSHPRKVFAVRRKYPMTKSSGMNLDSFRARAKIASHFQVSRRPSVKARGVRKICQEQIFA